MSKFNHKKKMVLRDYAVRTAIVLASVSLIVYFLPREGRFNYQFDIGRPWRYGQLIATFDFPIYKNSVVVQREQDSVLRLYRPYYHLNENTAKQQTDRLRAAFNTKLKGQVPAGYLPHVVNALKIVYARGVTASDDFDKFRKDSITTIRVFTENEATERTTSSLFSTRSAYEYVMHLDTANYDRNVLQRCNLNEYLAPNLTFDERKSAEAQKDLLTNLSYANGMVLSGQKIVDRGEIVDEQTYRILESLHKESLKRSDASRQARTMLAGQIICVSFIVLCFTLYLGLFRRDYFEKPRSLLLLFSLIVIFPVLSSLMVSHNLYSVYLLPYAMTPLFIRVFMDSRTAAMAHVTMIMLCSVALRSPYEFMLVQIIAGMAAIYSLRELSQRSQLIRSAGIVMAVSMVFYFSIELIRENDISKIDRGMYTYFVINGLLLLFAYPLMFLLEKMFGFTSNVTLVELSNVNNFLLRKMSEVAPGTFQHSMQVANLAAEVANKVGARSQLVRTGALYHDIGKTERPAFFTENQAGINPHERLRFDQSALIIISHVTDGLKLADKYNLPTVIKDFISTHHGCGKTKFFYISYKNKFPNEPIDDALFTYPGPNPFTLEQAILMMADAVEAASHSLKEYSEENLTQMVNTIIDGQVADGFFRNCPITFADIALAKEVFAEKLRTVYHTRISYPKAATPVEPDDTTDTAPTESKEENINVI